MATVKISEMTTATSFENDDYTMIVQNNKNKKITKQNMLGNIETNITNNSNKIGNLTQLDTTEKSSLVGAINENVDNISKIGKKLWEGSFTSGSITVDGLDDYTVFIFVLDPTIYCIGSKTWGMGGIGAYASYNTQLYNYRFNVNGNTLSIDNNNKGGSNGSSNVAVKAIYGLF